MQVEYIDHSGNDLLVVNAARVSFAKEKQKFDEKDAKLIDFLAREKHVLPFRHPSITLRCKAPLFLARQLGKHQTGMSWSEESRRYIDSEPEFFWPDKWRKRADNVKQGSSDEEVTELAPWANYDDPFGEIPVPLSKAQEIVQNTCMSVYSSMLDSGVAPELARMILPQNMYVNWVWTGSLLAWVHMIQLRTGHGAQKEAVDFAKLVEDVIKPLFPVSYPALMRTVV